MIGKETSTGGVVLSTAIAWKDWHPVGQWSFAGDNPEKLRSDHPAWELEAGYLALALNNFICTISPQRIIIGGGVMKHPGLMAAVRREVDRSLGGYIRSEAITKDIDHYIVPPALGDLAGVIGALELAKRT